MVPWVWWLFVLLAPAAEYSSETDERKIYGGREVSNGEFPYAVFILFVKTDGTGTADICGGTIATLSRIISAAHCFIDKISDQKKDLGSFEVIGGTLRPLKDDEGKQIRKVVATKFHERYGKRSRGKGGTYHDITVADLNKPFEESNTLSVMKVASLDEQECQQAWEAFVKTGKHCTAVGWGATSVTAPSSETLKAVDLKVWSKEECKNVLKDEDDQMSDKGEVCLSQLNPGESICHGDSGGPLICDGYVFGLAHSAVECGSAKRQHFLLFWPYLNYFGLSAAKSAQKSPNSPDSPDSIDATNSTGSYDSLPSLICFTAILTTSIL